MSAADWTPIRKIVASLLAGATSTGVIALFTLFHVNLDQTTAAAIVGLATVLAGYLTPSAPPAEPAPLASDDGQPE